MISDFPVTFHLKDGTHVVVYEAEEAYEFYLTRLNSEKHNFFWINGRIEESYETRFDALQEEAVALFSQMLQS